MAAFASMSAAEARVKAKGPAGDKTWVNAHTCRLKDGTIAVRVQRYMSPASAVTRAHGAWVEITDDATV